jgi:ribonuclease-3
VVASILYDRYLDIDEGDLSRLRANLVKQQSLFEIAQKLELSQFLRLGEGELKSGGFRRPSILADTLEALLGAIFLDGGFNPARCDPRLLHSDPGLGRPADAGQGCQDPAAGIPAVEKISLPQYNVMATHGAAHSQEFEIECLVPKLGIQVFGRGGSRRAGEQAAAKLALEVAEQALQKAPAAAASPSRAQPSSSWPASPPCRRTSQPPGQGRQQIKENTMTTERPPPTSAAAISPSWAAPTSASRR